MKKKKSSPPLRSQINRRMNEADENKGRIALIYKAITDG